MVYKPKFERPWRVSHRVHSVGHRNNLRARLRQTTGIPYFARTCDQVSFEQWIGAMGCVVAHSSSFAPSHTTRQRKDGVRFSRDADISWRAKPGGILTFHL